MQLDGQKRRWESNPLEAALQAAAVPSGSSAKLSVSSPRVELGLRPSHGRVLIRHTPRTFCISAPPRNRTPSCRFVVCRAIRYTCRASVSTRTRTWIWTFGGSYAIPCTIETFSIPTRSRTGTRALGEPRAIRYTIGTDTPEPTTGFAPASCGLQDRRLSQSSHVGKHEREESNPVRQGWNLPALPGEHSCLGARPCGREPA